MLLVAHRGRIVQHEAYGHAQVRPTRVPMRRDTIFDLASLTKPCATALALMQLADAGVLSLRDRIAAWLPRFTGGRKETVTIRDLATHTGGLDDRGLYDPAHPMVTLATVNDLLWGKELFAPSGTAYLYADLNYITLGLVVEAAAGMPLDRWVAARIARPLDLRDFGFRPPRAKWSRCASTETGPNGMLRGAVHDPRARDLGGVAGHAGLFGNARDVWSVAQLLLDGGRRGRRRLLSQRAAAVMTSVQSPAGLRPRTTSDPAATSFRLGDSATPGSPGRASGPIRVPGPSSSCSPTACIPTERAMPIRCAGGWRTSLPPGRSSPRPSPPKGERV